ncbi:MAG: Rrf2 family transcriptional regulator [Kiritimatiellaeota bacterium]|nr:Rrf2 family transcriptional regulator [Kiritimatiellota bacterium]
MIAIPESCQIAIHTLALLAETPGSRVPCARVAEACHISSNHLAKVVARLARAGIAGSQRGPGGGVTLLLDPKKTTLAMVWDAVEGRATPRKGCLLPAAACPGRRCVLGRFLYEKEAEIRRVLQTTTLADIVRPTPKKRK